MSETKGRNREDATRGCRLSIALHPNFVRPQSSRRFTDDSGQALDLPPNRCGFSYRCDFGGKQLQQRECPFAQASEADRNGAPGYSWPPHLYQEKLSLGERQGKSERKFNSVALEKVLQLEGLERDVLGGDEEFAGESGIGGAAAQGFFGGEPNKVGIVIFLGDVGEHEIARDGVEAVGIGKVFADGVIRKVAGAAENALFDDPRIRADLQHVEVVIGFEDQAIGATKMDFDELGHIAEVGDDGDLCAVRTEGETDGVGSVVWNGKRVDVNVADGEVLAGVDRFNSVEALAESFRENALHGVQCGLGDVKRRFPEAEHLRQTIAVVGVFVGDEDAVEMADGFFNGGETGQRFALAESGVHEEAGALGLE